MIKLKVKKNTGDRILETGDRILETGDRRQEGGDGRQETGGIEGRIDFIFGSSQESVHNLHGQDAFFAFWATSRIQ